MASVRKALTRVSQFARAHPSLMRWLVLALTFAALTGFAFLPMSWEETSGNPMHRGPDGEPVDSRQVISTITVLWFPVRIIIAALTIGLSALLWWLASKQLSLRNYPFAVIGLTLSLCGGPASGLVHCGTNVLFWHTVAEVEAPDGSTYYYLNSSFLQGQTLCLARLEKAGILTRRMRALACTGGDHPRSYLVIVRSVEDARTNDGQVLLCREHVVVLRGSNEAYLAFDTKTKEAFSGEELGHLSPFLCLGPDSDLAQPDVAALQRSVARAEGENETDSVYPDRLGVSLGLNHPNPKVRDLARRMMR